MPTHQPIVRALRRMSLLGIAAIAILALTSITAFLANRREDRAVLALRDRLRVAREAYVFAVERDDLLRGLLIEPERIGAVRDAALRDSMFAKLDTLATALRAGTEEDSLVTVARSRLTEWERAFVGPVLAGQRPAPEADLIFFPRIRAVFAALGSTFDAQYSTAVREGDDLRFLSVLFLLLELVLILAGMRMAHLRLQRYAWRVIESQNEIACRLGDACEFRDDQTGQHADRVGRLAAQLARAMGWTDHQVALMRRAAPLHDVGKIGIPDHILLKPGPLSNEERMVMETHTTIGASILGHGQSEIIRMAGDVALAHHERWDGSGYPFGRSGVAIPVAARIVAVADVFDALTTNRPYRNAWKVEEVLDELRRLRGTHLDPAAVDTFLTTRCYEERPPSA